VYKPIISNLSRFGQVIEDEARARAFVDLLRSRQSPGIANQNLSLLKSFGTWCVDTGVWSENHFKPIARLKRVNTVSDRDPFTLDELSQIFTVLQEDKYYSHYHDFCLALLNLGLRPSEAIGLRWSHIDLSKRRVNICESLSRSPDGRTSGYARQRKGTKTGTNGVLPLPDVLRTALTARWQPDTKPDDLVFLSPKGKPIDDHTFSQRVWHKVLSKAGVRYRCPYTLRHTLISYGIEDKGWSLPQAARIARHRSTRMVQETYGHMINLPEMPEF
ncbi:MAG: site-specific integrase, partial [Cyanothece sp. SIO2G6]|nr:site-specific integrase [Cyanothece sp. SIO2G6]